MSGTDPLVKPMLAIAATLLEQGDRLDQLSRILTVGGLIGLVGSGVVGLQTGLLSGAMALAGLVELYFAFRVALDAVLFRQLARDGADWQSFDGAMTRLGLLPPAKAGRSAEARIAGALRLLRCQAVALAVQVALVVMLALCEIWLRR